MSAMDWFNRNLSWPNPIKGGIKLFVESVKEFKENVNIYELSGPESYPIGINALFYALNNNNKKIANKLLDILEKDLKTLDKWNLSSALVVQDQLLIDEVLSICENEFVDGSEPVLIKYNNNSEQNKIVFLRMKLRDRKDPSLLLKEKIQKNGICDVNWQPESLGGDTLLHYAVAGGMSEIVDRLLKIPMIKRQIKNSKGLSPLYYACSRGQYQSAILLASG